MRLSEVQYVPNKFGKKMLDDGYYLEIEEALNDEEPVLIKKESIKPKEVVKEPKVIEEAIMTKNKQHIRLSRLDLFDDED